MTVSETEIKDEELSERHRTFLARLREHDKRVKVVRTADKLSFHGPIIGDGPMPDSEPAASGPEDEPEETP